MPKKPTVPVVNLSQQLGNLNPVQIPGRYVFVCVDKASLAVSIDAIGKFREAEGWSLIVAEKEAVAHGLDYSLVTGWITLNVHSDLASIGLTSAVSRHLAEASIPCNVVAAFHHDHLFVPYAETGHAIEILKALQNEYAD